MRRALGFAGVAFAVAACSGATPPRAPSEVKIHLEADPPHLNPLLGDALALRIALGDVYEPLWFADPKSGALTPALAESWWRSPDDRDWIVTLRAGVTWHDGAPFGADDVVFTYSLLRPGGVATLVAADFDDLEAVEARDARTVRFRFGGFRVGRDRNMAGVAILPAHVFRGAPPGELAAHPATRAPVGTGPYRFESWEPGRSITLARARPPAEIDRVVYRVIADRQQALAQLRAQTLDVMPQIPGVEIEPLSRDARFRVIRYDAPSFLAVAWNVRRGFLVDPRVRRALTMLLDRATIVREIYKGQARLTSGPWEPGSPEYDATIAPLPFDPPGARALFDEAGVGGVTIRLLVGQESRVLDRIATVWQADAESVGIRISVETAPWGEVVRRARAGDFDGVAFSWMTAPEQDFYHHFHSSQVGAENYGAVNDPELDRLLEEIRRTDQKDARVALEHRVHRRLHELQVVTFVTADVRNGAARQALHGLELGVDRLPARLLRWSKP